MMRDQFNRALYGARTQIAEVTFMTRFFSVALTLMFGVATSAYAGPVTEQQVEGVQKASKAIGCTVDDGAIETCDGYAADDVECADGNYDMVLDKDFKHHGEGEGGLGLGP
jgi:hypothetical protein